MSLLEENRVCEAVLIELYSEDKTDYITLPILEFGNRESIHTYKTAKFTKAERLRQSFDESMAPTDYVYTMEWQNLNREHKDAFEKFYIKYAGRPVWLKTADCVWRFGYILNSSITSTTVRDKRCGTFGVSL